MPSHTRPVFALLAACLLLMSCAETELVLHTAKQMKPDPETDRPATPATQGRYKVGDPYKINGVFYYPAVDYDYVETGIASWYGPKFNGRPTANGETFDMNALTAAHRTLPMPSMVRVTNLDNGRTITLRVNDRGPFAHGRIVDVSRRGAQLLGFQYRGTARVRVELMPDESRRLAALAKRGIIADTDKIEPVRAGSKIETAELSPPNGSAEPSAAEKAVNGVRAEPTDRTPDLQGPVINHALGQEPVRVTALYVQAGAFVRYANAQKLRSQLANVAPAHVSEARVGSEKFFRVRLGPFQNLGKADRALAEVTAAGYPRAQLIVVD